MAEKKQDIQTIPSKSPAELIAAAVSAGTDLGKLEMLLSLQERWQATEAKKAYHKAMAAFKKNPPEIDKDKKVSYGNTKYNHASLANITEKINKSLSEHGLSASWATQQNGAVIVTCKITHELGHSEETTLSAAADTSGSKNAIQAIGSAITYLQRYTLLALTGLAAHDVDDDGASTSVAEQKVTEEEIQTVQDWIVSADADEGKLLKHLGVKKLEDMTKKDYNKAVSVLKARKEQNDKRGKNGSN